MHVQNQNSISGDNALGWLNIRCHSMYWTSAELPPAQLHPVALITMLPTVPFLIRENILEVIFCRATWSWPRDKGWLHYSTFSVMDISLHLPRISGKLSPDPWDANKFHRIQHYEGSRLVASSLLIRLSSPEADLSPQKSEIATLFRGCVYLHLRMALSIPPCHDNTTLATNLPISP